MQIHTIGFSKKSLKDFIHRLKANKIKKIIDVRLNNTSQLAGFAKKEDLQYILELVGIRYEHCPELAPTEEILKNYKHKKISWVDYEKLFKEILQKRQPSSIIIQSPEGNICFLCSEDKPYNCHRKLVAEYFQCKVDNITIKHL